MSETPPPMSNRRRLLAIPIVVILFPVAYSLLGGVVPRGESAVHASLEMPDPQHESCVRDTMFMRYHHWELLTQVRDEVMRHGKRGSIGLIGLNRCRECHTSRENFCNHCHDAVNLYPTCWGCHYYP
jgi:hypothetical protein